MKIHKRLENGRSHLHHIVKFLLAVILVAGLIFGNPHTVFADLILLDPAFGTGGYVTTPISSSIDEGVAVALQSDAKIVVAGYSYFFEGHDSVFVVTRYNTDGSLDTSFDSDGIVTTSFSSSGYDQASDMVLQGDGKILVTGASYGESNYNFGLVRYNSDGSLDSGFGTNGVVTTDYGEESITSKVITLQSDGKIIVAGNHQSNENFKLNFLLARYSPNGDLDTTFDGDGIVFTSIGSESDWINSIAIQTDGKILVAGVSENGTDQDFAAARYTIEGTLDPSFGTGGIVTFDINNEDDEINDIAIQSDGKIILVGSSRNASFTELTMVRLNPDGTLDTSFNQTGIVTKAVGYHTYGTSVLLNENGKIIVTGMTRIESDYDIVLVRFNSNGALDTTFNISGVVITDLVGDDYYRNSAMQTDGKIVLTGATNNYGEVFVARFAFTDSFDSYLPIVLKD